MDDAHFIRMAIDAAKKCTPEDARIHPKVGVVVVQTGELLAVANRGELEPGEHAEFTALERKLPHDTLVGATVYTTLEPCTTRPHPKVACVERLIERKVGRVCIGMLDPNGVISGKGLQRLRDANIRTDLFPDNFMAEVEELNREFVRQHRQAAPRGSDNSAVSSRTVHLDGDSSLLRPRIPVGDYLEIHRHGLVLRVEIEEIMERQFSRTEIHARKQGVGCRMKVSNGGRLFFCGPDCEKNDINEFTVPTKEFSLEEPVSVYFFSANTWHRFVRLFVEHINRHTGVVTLNVFVCQAEVVEQRT
jgi:pyrimidine deaminase RibD-like protein